MKMFKIKLLLDSVNMLSCSLAVQELIFKPFLFLQGEEERRR